MRGFIMFGIAALIAAALAPRYFDRTAGHAASPASAPAAQVVAAPPPTYSGGPRTVVVQRDMRGHFVVEGAVNGRRIGFMVDTGATRIALTERDASRLGYHPGPRDYVGQVQTANGVARVAPVKLDMVEIGGIMIRNVDALVTSDGALSENLLGLSFLSRLHRFEYREGRLVLEE
jgi:aspartyl protease family protein